MSGASLTAGYFRLKALRSGQWAVMRGYGMKTRMEFRGEYDVAAAKLADLRGISHPKGWDLVEA